VELWEKYTGEEEEHGQMLRWMRQLGYHTGTKKTDMMDVGSFFNFFRVTEHSFGS
jgi:hypothetical protein